jgi:hypothetical protein
MWRRTSFSPERRHAEECRPQVYAQQIKALGSRIAGLGQEGRSSVHGDRHHGSKHEGNDIPGHHVRSSHRTASVGCDTRARTDVFAPARVSTVIVRTGRGARASPTGVRHTAEM